MYSSDITKYYYKSTYEEKSRLQFFFVEKKNFNIKIRKKIYLNYIKMCRIKFKKFSE